MNLQMLTGDIVAIVLDTYSDNVTINDAEYLVVEPRWRRDMETEIARIIKEHLKDAVANL